MIFDIYNVIVICTIAGIIAGIGLGLCLFFYLCYMLNDRWPQYFNEKLAFVLIICSMLTLCTTPIADSMRERAKIAEQEHNHDHP